MKQDALLIGYIRTACRSGYDLQKLRISIGNRVTRNFKSKLGLKADGMSDKELEKESKMILERLRKTHRRITDAIVGDKKTKITKAYIENRFVGDDIITELTEYYLVDNYVKILEAEKSQFDDMERMIENIPIYKEFLLNIPGMGPLMAGVIISELDIYKAEYPSSFHKYAGLDTVRVLEVPREGKNLRFSFDQINDDPNFEHMPDGSIQYKGETCLVVDVGRNKESYCLVDREYEDKNKEWKTRKSITFSPFLKTKLIGVLSVSFLRASSVRINGKSMNPLNRLNKAKEVGFVIPDDMEEDDIDDAVLSYLEQNNFTVKKTMCSYAQSYYDYRARIEKEAKHKDKMKIVQHRMALRYCIKRFLVDLHIAWRTLEGLPVSTEYSVGVLGKIHGVAKDSSTA